MKIKKKILNFGVINRTLNRIKPNHHFNTMGNENHILFSNFLVFSLSFSAIIERKLPQPLL